MKIAGVVIDYKDALDIEDIVRVFIIKKRIYNILSLEKNKNFKKANSNIMKFPKNDSKYAETSDEKILHTKINEDYGPVFNVRGLI